MTDQPISTRTQALAEAVQPFLRFFTASSYARKAGMPGVNDFAIGNPHEMPLPGLVNALQRQAVPQDEEWFAYKRLAKKTRGAPKCSRTWPGSWDMRCMTT